MISSEQLRRTVLQSMINNEVLDQYAQEAGYRVTDAALLGAIRSNPQFQANGEFSAQRYRGLLAQAGIAPAQYEASLRSDLKGQQLRGEISQSAFASPAEVDQAWRLANQQRRVRYLAFDPANYRDAVDVSDDEIESYYQDNNDAFQAPERVKLSYVSLDRASAQADATAPDTQTLRELFDQNRSQFGEAERRSGRRLVEHGKPDTGQQLVGQHQHRQRAEVVPDVEILGGVVLADVLVPQLSSRKAGIDPVHEPACHLRSLLAALVRILTHHYKVVALIAMRRHHHVQRRGHARIDAACDIELGTMAGAEEAAVGQLTTTGIGPELRRTAQVCADAHHHEHRGLDRAMRVAAVLGLLIRLRFGIRQLGLDLLQRIQHVLRAAHHPHGLASPGHAHERAFLQSGDVDLYRCASGPGARTRHPGLDERCGHKGRAHATDGCGGGGQKSALADVDPLFAHA